MGGQKRSNITYTCAKFDFNQEEPLLVENYEPKIITTIDQLGRPTPMAYGVMVGKDIQGRPSSKLLKILLTQEVPS